MKKIIATALTLSLALTYASCGQSDSSDTDNDTASTDNSSDGTIKKDDVVSDDLGSYDFGGEEFSIYTRFTPWFYPYLDVTEVTGDVLNDAIYDRNRKIEERFNFKFAEYYYDTNVEGGDAPRKLLLAGDDTYDLQEGRSVYLFNYASEGFLYSLDEIPLIDTSKLYWNEQLYNDLSICGTHYFAVGAFNISAYDFTHVMLFNKGMREAYQLDDPYTLVREQKWTYDKFAELARSVVSDINGDSVMDENDQYGFTSVAKQVMPCFWIAANTVSMDKNKDGELEYSAMTSEKFIEVCQKIYTITWEDNVWHRVPISVDGDEELTLFCEGHGLFTNSSCFQISKIRDTNVDFGIIPYPKYSLEQDKYYSRIEGCELFGVPRTNPDTEMAGVILEAMACESLNSVAPAYYDVALKVKFTRDNESAEMLDIIFENRVFDYGDTLLCTEFRDDIIRKSFAEDNRNIVSTLTTVQSKVEKKLNKLNEAFTALADE